MLFDYVTLIPATTRLLTNSQTVAHSFFLFFRRHNSINRAQTLTYTAKLSKENKNFVINRFFTTKTIKPNILNNPPNGFSHEPKTNEDFTEPKLATDKEQYL
jgi:hypothetical protein